MKLEGQTSPRVQGIPYPKLKTPRIWPTIFYERPKFLCKKSKNKNERHSQCIVGGCGASTASKLWGPVAPIAPPPRFPRPWLYRPSLMWQTLIHLLWTDDAAVTAQLLPASEFVDGTSRSQPATQHHLPVDGRTNGTELMLLLVVSICGHC